jgi:anti-sigma-K factor RskA
MNIRDNLPLREKLAAEYVLGTLKGHARRRFEGWMHNDAALRRTTAEWQDRLMPMAEFSGAVKPRAEVWTGIERRLNLKPQSSGWAIWGAEAVGFWRSLGLASSAFAAVLLFVLATKTMNTPTIDHVATLTDAQSQTALLVTADTRRKTIAVRVMDNVAVASDKVLELWAIPKDGPPRSLGLVPKDKTVELALTDRAIGSDVVMLAISLEPTGGSTNPNGPTGPVLYKGAWVRM